MRKVSIAEKIITALLTLSLSAAFCNASVLYPHLDTLQLLPLLDTSIIKFSVDSVSTCILEDFGGVTTNLEAFDGTALRDTNYVNFHTLNRIAASLSSSRTNRTILIPEDLTEQMSQHFTSGNNPVGIVAYKYSRTRPRAVENNLLDFQGGKFFYKHTPQGEWINPYEDKYVFAFSPYMNIVGSTVTFSFDTSLRYSNLPITVMLFDPGDGQGFRTVNLNNSASVTATYPNSVNQVELKLRIVLSGGVVLNAHSFGSVLRAPTSSSGTPIADHIEQFDTTYVDYPQIFSALMSVKYANGSSLTKPLIIAEGFDPFSDPDGFNSDGTGRGMNNIDNIRSIVRNKILLLGYDIIYIDWLDSRAPIQANASLLKRVIRWVNENKPSTAEKSILIGQSMGGLISRYALRSMEREGTIHDVKAYVSDDAPHFGVNVPSGYLYAMQKFLGGLTFLDNTFISDLITFLTSIFTGGGVSHASTYINEVFDLREAPSVRQMLMHYISPQLTYDSQMYTHFQDTLDILGFPKGDAGQSIHNLAISNGGVNDYSNNLLRHLHFDGYAYSGFIAALLGAVVSMSTETFLPCLLGILLTGSGPRFRLNVYPNYNGTQRVYDDTLSWKARHGLFEGMEKVISYDAYDVPANPHVFDSDYGSYYSIPFDAPDSPLNGGDALWGGYELQLDMNDRIMFVPTVSSLAYREKRLFSFWNPDDRTIDFESDAFDRDLIPFDGYKFVADSSTYHTHLNPEDIEWLDRMMCLSITPLPSLLPSGYQFTITDTDSTKGTFATVWSIEDTDVAHINPYTGEVTLELGGTTNVIADVDFKGGHYRLKKQFTMNDIVFPGFPTYTLSKNADPGFGASGNSINYTITATESASIDTTFTNHMVCHWGVKENTNSQIQWTTTPYVPFHHWLTFFCNLPNTANARIVYFYVSFQNQVSPTHSIVCTIPPSMFLLDGNGNLYTEDMDEPFAQVKGEITDGVYYFSCVDKSLTYNHWPTWAEFGRDMLESDEFVALLKSLKPWGEEELIMIPYSYHSNDESEEEYGVITVKFDETL